MRQLFYVTSMFLFLISTNLFAQNPGTPGPVEFGRMGSKIEQLEKIKLIEELNMDEETAIKFFARRNIYRKNMRQLIQKKDSMYKKLKTEIDSSENILFEEKTNNIFNLEKQMFKEREKFIDSLSDILSEKQRVQFVLFEYFFRNEIRNQFMKQGRKRMMKH